MFEDHLKKLFGARAEALLAALRADERQVARPNAFARGTGPTSSLGPWVEGAAGEIPRSENGLLAHYVMDAASIVAARALEAQPGDRVLDLCAAPGGKTLVLAEALFAGGGRGGELIANEPSPDRRERLIKVIQQYVPRETRESIFVRGADGVKFGLRESESFDRVLVDAPCSGERHLLRNPTELARWKPSRSEHLSTRQYSLLAAAWLAVRPGGRIVYSTCSLEPGENDEVVRRLVKKKGARVIPAVDLPAFVFGGTDGVQACGEVTEFGWRFLPDRAGLGPIYFSAIEK